MFNKLFLNFLSIFRKTRLRQGESINWDALYRTISYRFKNEQLLEQAMTHRSALQFRGRWMSNERMEFLGDAVLGFIITDELYSKFPEGSEGDLTKAKSLIVSRESLATRAKHLDLGRFLILGRGEERSGGRLRRSILSNSYEALLGAIYLDGGILPVRNLIRKDLLKNVDDLVANKFHHNYKSWLLEYVQARGMDCPVYRVLEETGPDHLKQFTVEVLVDGKVMGDGEGASKKRAEKAAAREAIKQLGLLVGD